MNFDAYSKIRETRDREISKVSHDHFLLNQFHEEITLQVIEVAIKRIYDEYGPTPAPYSFFTMGSGGRFEKAIWSDQDHGIIYNETSKDVQNYFLKLGKEISEGLYQLGYDYCDGGVMASNPFWCKSLSEWEQQLTSWIEESSWESIRNLLIFVDSRSIYGESGYIDQLKHIVYESIHKEKLLHRVLYNTMNLKKGVGVLGQLLTETHGIHTGSLNIKEKALYPYVNAIRILAIKAKIIETSTLARIDKLPEHWFSTNEKKMYKEQLLKLLNYRLQFGDHTNYEAGHFLLIDNLSKNQRKEIKEIIKTGISLYQHAIKIVEKED